MSRYPMTVTRQDGERFTLVCGTDHASFKLGFVPHCFAQIYGTGVDVLNGEESDDACLWSVDVLTPAELVEALDANPILKLGEFEGPYDSKPAEERWLSDYALDLFARQLDEMAEG